jgi:hypothetical protein
MFREIMAIRTSQMMTSRSLICLLENQNGGTLQKNRYTTQDQFVLLFFTNFCYFSPKLHSEEKKKWPQTA